MSYLNEEKIAKIEEELGSLPKTFDLLDDHVVITDPDGIVIYVNKAAEYNTGFTKDELIGKNPGKAWGGNMPKSFYEQMWKTIKIDKKPFIGEVKNKKKDGTEYWQELRVFPVLDENGEIKVFIGIEPNITARKVAEGEAKKKFEEMDKLNSFMVGRELKMIELKKEIAVLKENLINSEIGLIGEA